jgi:Mg-chelatase subunit ChlD
MRQGLLWFEWLKRKEPLHLTLWALLLCVFLTASFCADARPTAADDLRFFRASQVVSEYPRIRIFLTLPRESATSGKISPETLQARLGDAVLPVRSVRPFSREEDGVAYIFLVDVSKSLREAQLADMRIALSAWVDAMGPKDRAMVITFGERVHLLRDFDGNSEALRAAVRTLRPTDMLTELHGGLARALDMGKRLDPGLPSRKVIVVLSDGKNEMLGGITRAEVLRRMEEGAPPIFALGYFAPPLDEEKREHLRLLGELATSSGGAYFQPDGTPVETIFTAMRSAIDDTLVVDLDAGAISPDGSLKRLFLSLKTEDATLTYTAPLRLLPSEVRPASASGDSSAEQTLSANSASGLTPPSETPESAKETTHTPETSPAGTAPAEKAPETAATPEDTLRGGAPSDTAVGVGAAAPEAQRSPETGAAPTAHAPGATKEEAPPASEKTRTPSPSSTKTGGAAPEPTPGTAATGSGTSGETSEAKPASPRLTPLLAILLGGIALIAITTLLLLPREQRRKGTETGPGTSRKEHRSMRLRMEISRSGKVLGAYAADITERIVLGRGSECDVRLSGDETVSHRHCELSLAGGILAVRDLGSTNGTLLDGTPVPGDRAIPVTDGARLLLGNTTVTLFPGATSGDPSGERRNTSERALP